MVFLIFSCMIVEVSYCLVRIISPSWIGIYQALYWYFYFFLQEFWDLLSLIYLRDNSPERKFSRLISATVIAHCTALQNILSINYSFHILNNLSTLVSHCQHLQFRSSSSALSHHTRPVSLFCSCSLLLLYIICLSFVPVFNFWFVPLINLLYSAFRLTSSILFLFNVF